MKLSYNGSVSSDTITLKSDGVMRYQTIDGRKWSAKFVNGKFIRALNGDWSKAEESEILEYANYGSKWFLKFENGQFHHANNRSFSGSHSDQIAVYQGWNGRHETLKMIGGSLASSNMTSNHQTVNHDILEYKQYRTGKKYLAKRVGEDELLHAPNGQFTQARQSNIIDVVGNGTFVRLNRDWRKDGERLLYEDWKGDAKLTALGENDFVTTYGRAISFVNGGDGDDSITSYTQHDVISGGKGNDLLQSYYPFTTPGSTRILGGDGNDVIHSTVLNSVLEGEDGDDSIYGGEGYQFLKGGTGNDLLVGGRGNDRLEGGDGDDVLHGDFYEPFLATPAIYYKGADGNRYAARWENQGQTTKLMIAPGADWSKAYEAEEFKYIGADQSIRKFVSSEHRTHSWSETKWTWAVLFPIPKKVTHTRSFQELSYLDWDGNSSHEEKTLNFTPGYFSRHDSELARKLSFKQSWVELSSSKTGAGNDYFIGGKGSNKIYGGIGNDTIDYSFSNGVNISLHEVHVLQEHTPTGTVVNLDKKGGRATGVGFYDWLTGIENVEGSNGNDVIQGNAKNNILRGHKGNDQLMSEGGSDRLEGGDGNDTLYATAAANGSKISLNGGRGEDIFMLNLAGRTSFTLDFDTQKLGKFVENLTSEPEDPDAVWKNLGKDLVIEGLGLATSKIPGGSFITTLADFGLDYLQSQEEAKAREKRNRALIKEYDQTAWGEILQQNSDRDTIVIEDFVIGVDSIVLPDLKGSALGYEVVANTAEGGSAFIKVSTSEATESVKNLAIVKNQYTGDLSDTEFAALLQDMISGSVLGSFKHTPIKGSDSAETRLTDLTTTYANDTVEAFGGDDIVKGLFGDDLIVGGNGDDTLYGGTGGEARYETDFLKSLYAHDGHDILLGGDGDDKLHGESGNDILVGGAGADTLVGGAGADTFVFDSVADGIDVIKDFNAAQGDRIEINEDGFGAASKYQFSFNVSTGALSFNNQQFATLNNAASSGFSVHTHLTLV